LAVAKPTRPLPRLILDLAAAARITRLLTELGSPHMLKVADCIVFLYCGMFSAIARRSPWFVIAIRKMLCDNPFTLDNLKNWDSAGAPIACFSLRQPSQDLGG
jgi:hypothetical protein